MDAPERPEGFENAKTKRSEKEKSKGWDCRQRSQGPEEKNAALRTADVGGGRRDGFLGFGVKGRKAKMSGPPAEKLRIDNQQQVKPVRPRSKPATKKLVRAPMQCLVGVEKKWHTH